MGSRWMWEWGRVDCVCCSTLKPQKPWGNQLLFAEWITGLRWTNFQGQIQCHTGLIVRFSIIIHSPLGDGSQNLVLFSGTQKGHCRETEGTAEAGKAGSAMAQNLGFGWDWRWDSTRALTDSVHCFPLHLQENLNSLSWCWANQSFSLCLSFLFHKIGIILLF